MTMPEKGLSWVRTVDIEDLLDGDMKLVYEYCGTDVLLALWEHLPSLSIYTSVKSLDRIKRRYIEMHFNGHNIKELCAILKVSERFIYEVLEHKLSQFSERGSHG